MKRWIKMLMMLLALAACVAGYFVISGMEEETESVSETLGSFELDELASVTGLSWENSNGSFHFVLDGETWVSADDAAFPVNQSALSSLAKKVSGLSATREITEVSDLANYGLAEPVFTVTVTTDSGDVTLAMGDETPFGDGYYVSVSGRDAIYTLESSLSSAFNKTLTQLCQMETLADVDSVTRLSVSGMLDAAWDEEAAAWTDSLSGEKLDADKMQDLADAAKSLSFSTVVTASADEDDLVGYGLDDAQATLIALSGGEDTPLEVMIGAQDEDGDYYARIPGSSMVYTVYADDVEDLLTAGADTLWNRSFAETGFDELASATVAAQSGDAVITRTKVLAAIAGDGADEADEETDEAAEEAEPAYSVTLNGAADEEGAAESLWKLVAALSGTKRVEQAASGEAVLTVSWTDEAGRSRSASAYEYDVDNYLVPISDTHAMLVSADSVDKIIRTIRSL